ncbi:MAG: hypothetical protein WA840_09085 [Caulobacteraceae bacterium]
MNSKSAGQELPPIGKDLAHDEGEPSQHVALAPLRLFASNELVFVNPRKVVSVSRFHKATRVVLDAGAPLDVQTSLEETVALFTGHKTD